MLKNVLALLLVFSLSPYVYSDDESDLKESFMAMANAAEAGDVTAQYYLGDFYFNTQKFEGAIKWYRKAAAQGHAKAQYSLGYMYRNGLGVSKDYNKAFYWFTKAAEQGNVVAQWSLGNLYLQGWGVTQDNNKAFYWFKKTAEQGYVDSQYYLGNMYLYGLGVPRDYVQSYAWFQLAAEGGREEASAARMNLRRTMNSKELEEARKLVRELWEKYGNKNNN